MLDLYIASISNPLQYSESRQPLDAVTSYLTGKILKDIDTLQGNTSAKNKLQLYNATPSFQNRTKADLIAGKTNLGAVALSNSHHSLAQAVTLNNDRIAKTASKLGIHNLHGIYSNKPNYHDKQRIVTLISDWISALVNAHVDVAKDPYINRLNVRKFTMNVTNFLLRAGKGESTFYFLSQKILRDIADAFEAYSGFYGVENVSSPSTAAKTKIKNEYLEKAKSLLYSSDSEIEEMVDKAYGENDFFDIDYLRESMPFTGDPNEFGRRDAGFWYVNQLAILKAYENIEPYARALSELTKLSQIDTKKFGNNYALQQNFLMKMADFAFNNKTYAEPLSIIRDTFLKDKLLYGLIRPRKYLGRVLLRTTPEFENKRRYIYKLTGRKQAASDSYVNNITRAMEACYKSKFWYDYAIKNGIDINALFKGNMSIPKRLYRVKKFISNHPELGLLNSDGSFNNALLDSIDTLLKTDKQANLLPDFLQFKYNKSDDHNLDDHIIRAWEELLEFTVTNPELQDTAKAIRNFARDLAVYAFLSSGDAFGKNNIFKYVPNSFRESSGYYDYIRHLESNPEELNDLIKASEVIRSLWWNDDIVPSIDITSRSFDETGNEVKTINSDLVYSYSDKVIVKNNGAVQDIPGVLILNGNISHKHNLVIGTSKEGQALYKPFIKVNYSGNNNPLTTELYRYAGYKLVQNKNRQYILPVYVLTSKVGMNYKGMVLSEFNSNKSILSFNNNKSYNLPSSFTKNKSFILEEENNYGGEAEYLESLLTSTYSTKNENNTEITEFTWDRYSDNGYEVSSKGDKRFSALNATFKPGTIIDGVDVSNMTIEDVYQKIIKKSGKGKAPSTDSKLYNESLNTKEEREEYSYTKGYLPLWQEWAKQNPELIEDLRNKAQGKVLTDQFANTRVSQARALSDILNNTYKEDISNTNNSITTVNSYSGDITLDDNTIPVKNESTSISDTSKSFDNFVKEAGDSFDETVVKNVKSDIAKQTATSKSPSFTFKNGFTVKTDFELNEQQKEALNRLYDFYNSEESTFSLQGYAGTGKTTIMKIFDEYLNSEYVKPLYIAPTHKANVVTMINNPEVTAKTIHSFLGLQPDYNLMEDAFDLNKLQFSNTNNADNDSVAPGTFIIIDESSMIPDAMVSIIKKLADRMSYKIVYMGDPAQLGPVNQSTVSKSLLSDNKIELTKVERTGDNSILDAATRIRSNQPLQYKTDLNDNGDGIIYTNKRETLFMFLQNLVTETNFKDPLFLRVLTGVNNNIEPFNKIIREIRFGKGAPQLVKGDILMGYSNEQRTRNVRNPYNIINSVDYIVDSVGNRTVKDIPNTDGKIKISGFDVHMHNAYTGLKVKCFILDTSDKNNVVSVSKITALINKLWSVYYKLKKSNDIRGSIRILNSINTINNSFSTTNDIIDNEGKLIRNKTFDYAYTQTVHKSQGATYKNVIVLEDSFNKFDQTQRQKLKYVAITRAKNKVLYYTSSNNVNNRDITETTRSQIKEMQNNAKQLAELGKKRQNECK